MRFGTKKFLKRTIDFHMKQAILAAAPKEECDYYPINVHVDLTYDCNLKCIHCHDHNADNLHGTIDMKTFRRAVDQVVEIESGMTIGNKGEPFLNSDAPEMIKIVKDNGIFLNIISNATLLGPAAIDAVVSSGVDRLVLSIDSSVPDVYEQSRLGARYKQTFLNIMNLMRKNCEAGSPVFIYISCVAHQQALKTFDETKEYFSKLPVDTVFISPLHSQYGLTEIEDQTMFVKKNKINIPHAEHPVCMNGFNRMYVYPDGRVGLCDNEIFGHYTIGNVNDDTLRNMWNNDAAKTFRRALINRDYSLVETNGKICSICDFKWMQNLDDCYGCTLDLLTDEISDNDEFRRDLSKRHSSDKYEAVLKEISRLERL